MPVAELSLPQLAVAVLLAPREPGVTEYEHSIEPFAGTVRPELPLPAQSIVAPASSP